VAVVVEATPPVRVSTVARVEERLDTVQLLERAQVVRVPMAVVGELMAVAVVVVLPVAVEMGQEVMAVPEEPDPTFQLPVLLSPTRAVAEVGLMAVAAVPAALVAAALVAAVVEATPPVLTRVVAVVVPAPLVPVATVALVS